MKLRYQLTISGPQNIHNIAPNAMYGPYGMRLSQPFLLPRTRISPTTPPSNDETRMVNNVDCQPKKAPIAANSFTSPIPIASFRKINSPTTATVNNDKPPTTAPRTDRNNDNLIVAASISGGYAMLNTNPTISPPKVISFGMI